TTKSGVKCFPKCPKLNEKSKLNSVIRKKEASL
ncbi:unnamed protein product, partial [marine sediment metagenome]